MSIVSIILFCACIGIGASCARKGADAFSPARVFGFIWCFVLGLTDLKLSRLQHAWTLETWCILLTGPACFLLGVFLIFVVNIGQRHVPMDQLRRRLRSEPVNEERLYRSVLLLFGIYAVSYLIVYLVKGYIPLLSPEGILSRTEFSAFGVGLFLHLMPAILVFALLYHLLVESERRRKMMVKVVAAVTACSFLLLLQRFHFMMTGAICVVLLFYLTNRIRLKTAVIIFGTASLLFFWVSSLRTGELIQYYLYLSSKMKFSYHYALLTEPYMYFVMNLENFARSIERHENFSYGIFTFDFVTALSGVKHWLKTYFAVDDMPYLVSGYNTYTAFWTFYRDFGVVGLAAISTALGVVTGSLYARLRLQPSLWNLVSYSAVVFMMLISFFNFPFSLLWFVLVTGLMFVMLRYILYLPPPSPAGAP
jgi:oligosaccharide repeat unit polymerase